MEQNGVYIVGYREEILAPKFTAADLSAIKLPLVKTEEIPEICLLPEQIVQNFLIELK